jgi:uncharacterized protein (TIRG00374 family)
LMRKNWLKIVIGVVVLGALGALAYRSQGAIHLADFSWSKLARDVAGTNKIYLLGSVLAIYLAYFVRAVRWKRFCRHLGNCPLSTVWSGTMMGFTAMFVLGRPGEPVRPLLLARKCHMSISSMFGIYVVERLFDTAATAVLAGLSLLFFRTQFAGDSTLEARIRGAGGLLLIALLGVAVIAVYFRLHGGKFIDSRLRRWREMQGWRSFVATQVAGFGDGLQALRTFSDWWAATAYSGLHWALIALIYLWIMQSLGGSLGQLTYSNAMLVLAFTMLGSLIQLPGVGGGAQVATFIALTRVFQIEQEPAAAAAVLTWIVTFAGSCLVGLPLLVREGVSIGELRRLASAEKDAESSGAHLQLESTGEVSADVPAQKGDGAR